jgi:hypothetical protein
MNGRLRIHAGVARRDRGQTVTGPMFTHPIKHALLPVARPFPFTVLRMARAADPLLARPKQTHSGTERPGRETLVLVRYSGRFERSM